MSEKDRQTLRPGTAAPAASRDHGPPTERSSRADIEAFVARAQSTAPAPEGPRGRLMFALDATMSRQPTWDRACRIQAEMFEEAGEIGGLDIQLVYFRGFDECRASKWISNAERLRDVMTGIECRGGLTQIRKVLRRAIDETRRERVQAVVYVGDCMEEDVDALCARAGELGLLKVPVFIFQEGNNGPASAAFSEIARLTGGAHLSFSASAPDELRRLLRAVAVYAAGGRKALADMSARGEKGAQLLIGKMS
ncbi:hypothetical protein J2S73_003609 [Amorphus orientalis]|uniref:VWA domain-containing protein n=1 Tax=Amorphus orientalis TaxID=649198 RepID=A0AAE3VRP3_9HYPH|nr:VWA domain-containing protein [Amorphus orientalis]MDQ0317132.1 hypothetical protein [Amorphus orientalis]